MDEPISVTINIYKLCSLIRKKAVKAQHKNIAYVYMDCHKSMIDHLCDKYSEQFSEMRITHNPNMIVDINDIRNFLIEKVNNASTKREAKIYMICHKIVSGYLFEQYKHQTGIDLNNVRQIYLGANTINGGAL